MSGITLNSGHALLRGWVTPGYPVVYTAVHRNPDGVPQSWLSPSLHIGAGPQSSAAAATYTDVTLSDLVEGGVTYPNARATWTLTAAATTSWAADPSVWITDAGWLVAGGSISTRSVYRGAEVQCLLDGVVYVTVNVITAAAIAAALGYTPADAATVATDAELAAGLAGKVDTSDSRLTDPRTPTAHAASHAAGGSDAISVTAAQVSDSSTVGRSVLTAADQAAARAAIGAGTSSLALGTTGSTAAAGNHTHIDGTHRNILDYGVSVGTSASQTTAIKAALDANPGATFLFPRGDYRLDTPLVIGAGNSLVLDRDARIYAGAPMTYLIDWTWASAGYAEDKGISGGLLDGALQAATVLRINKVIRYSLTGVTIRDGINRGLFAGPIGAELIATDVRLYNTTATNVVDNVAIEAKMGDSHFRDVIIRDWTVAVLDTGGNRWDRVHPWIGPDLPGMAQMTNRYPTSIAFDLTGASDCDATVADTYRTAYKIRSNGTSYTAPPRLLNARAAWADPPTFPNAIGAANPGVILDNTDGVGAVIDRINVKGSVGSPVAFLTGPTTGLTSRNGYNYGFTTGVADYIDGSEQGNIVWTPTLYGSTTAGTPTYAQQTGRRIVNGDLAIYTARIQATLDSTIAGSLRLGGLPIPAGRSLRAGIGVVGYAIGAAVTSCIYWGAGSTYLSLLVAGSSGTTEVSATPLRGTTVDLWISITLIHAKA